MKKILKLLPKILMILGGVILVGVNLTMAYIMFAPDTLPKPFYLLYAGEAGQPATGLQGETAGLVPGSAQAAAKPEVVEPTPVVERGQGFMLDTGTKIINLVDQTGRKYLRAGVVLEFYPPDAGYFSMVEEEKSAYEKAFNEEMALKLPVINDIIITLLSSQTFESVYTAEGKEMLRKKIQEQVNNQLPEYQVIFVYFTEFVVQ
ncbi:MAG: flagellar basal body-associated FliL family protein [Chloroflexi bacterium]|nr:flagellar basal body-associated FliL family protein [Chloroflexota bacterium]